MQRVIRLVFVLALMLSLACPVQAEDLVVSAAASLTDAFQDMKPGFEKKNPGVTLVFNFAASGPLLKQMEQGAPVDVFASADQATMDQAAAKKLVQPASRVNFTSNSLVLAVPLGSMPVNSLQALSSAKISLIALGNPATVPAGRYAKAALTKAGLWDVLSGKFIMAENARQVLDYLVRGEVDAGFIFATDAKKAGSKVVVTAQVPLDQSVGYPIAVSQSTANSKAAQAFVRYVVSPAGQAILKARGFSQIQS